jgi:hypothetical protein
MGSFYDEGPLRHAAINLFYGWGYNFYRKENQLRADDQLVRAKVSWLLGRARTAVERAETDWRREKLPPPSRAQPFADPHASAAAQALERLAKEIGALKGRIEALPVPENDRMTQRYRQEAATLEALGQSDALLVGQADLLRSLTEDHGGEAILAANLDEGLSAIAATLHGREAILHAPA